MIDWFRRILLGRDHCNLAARLKALEANDQLVGELIDGHEKRLVEIGGLVLAPEELDFDQEKYAQSKRKYNQAAAAIKSLGDDMFFNRDEVFSVMGKE